MTLGLPQPAVSKHLGVLRKVGVVAVIKQGKQRVYNLEAEKLKTVHDWVKAFEELWGHQLDRIKERAERRAREQAESPTPLETPERTIMKTETSERQSVESFEICKEIEISAPIEIAFEAMLDAAWSGRADARRQAVPDENRAVARRTLVPRPRRTIPATFGAMCRSSSRRRSWRFAGRS